jgi:hypothetical protein
VRTRYHASAKHVGPFVIALLREASALGSRSARTTPRLALRTILLAIERGPLPDARARRSRRCSTHRPAERRGQ